MLVRNALYLTCYDIEITSYVCVLGIRSLSFKEDVLTIGTGVGHVLFFDIKAGKYFDCNCGHACTLNVGHGWLVGILFSYTIFDIRQEFGLVISADLKLME